MIYLVLNLDTPLPLVMGSEPSAWKEAELIRVNSRAWEGPELWCSEKLSALGACSELDPGPVLPMTTH